MSKRFISIVVVLVVFFSVIIFLDRPAFAISNGELDGDRHPNVGALFAQVVFDGFSERFPVCSGVLIAPTVFLTSGHCLAISELIPNIRFFVTFDPQFDPDSGNFIEVEEFYVYTEFDHDSGDLHDMAVGLLPEGSTNGITPAELPPINLLNEMSERCGLCNHNFVNVGYGVVPEWKKGPFRYEQPDGYRRISTSPFMALTKSLLKLNMNNDATDQGGVCYGDSGGPHFLSEDSDFTDIVVAITSDGDQVCRALNYNYRLDTPTARRFLKNFVDLP